MMPAISDDAGNFCAEIHQTLRMLLVEAGEFADGRGVVCEWAEMDSSLGGEGIGQYPRASPHKAAGEKRGAIPD